MSRDGKRKDFGEPMFADYARALKEMRHLNAIVKHGPRVKHIADGLGVKSNQFLTWLIDATHRHPQIWEDDKGRVYLGRQGEGEKEYARYYDV